MAQAHSLGRAKALYDYSRQTDEELSFAEDAILDIYDTSDPEWTLVGHAGEFGFAPANYIETADDDDQEDDAPPPPMPTRPQFTEPEPEEEVYEQPRNPAAALAGIIHGKAGAVAPRQPQYTPEASDEEQPPPSLPQRPQSQQLSPPQTQYTSPSPQSPEPTGVVASTSRGRGQSMGNEDPVSPSGYHIYNIHEMISHMGKNKKMPTTLGINVARGTILIAPEKSRDGPQQEWTAERLTHYSIEGKHVFVELVRPSKSIDFHAGAKDTAQEIVAALGELAGASRAEGLKEVFAAGSGKVGQKKGHMLYEFMAQGEDEVTVAENDEIIVLDDTKSDEWWRVRRLKNGREGVVPRQYVEVTGIIEPPRDPGLAQARSTVEQNRLEEERLTREALEASGREKKKKKRQSRAEKGGSDSKTEPNPANVRRWTDRTGSFNVDAEFLGLKDGKIHIHKVNGIKIAVAVNRMSVEDLEYVERMANVSLEEDKPLSDIKRRSTERRSARSSPRPQNGAGFEPSQPKYDWFDFFLQCGVNPQICQRYAVVFERDQMGEENLPDIQPTLLRTLGLKEGDILRVMKNLDERFGRKRENQGEDGENASGGIFSGPNGVLRNNTTKSRPSPATVNTDSVDPRAFEQNKIKKDTPEPSPTAPTPSVSTKASAPRTKASGFDDDAWDVKPSTRPQQQQSPPPPPPRVESKAQSPPPAAPVAAPAPQKPTPTGAMAELSLLSPPLQPQPAPAPATTAPLQAPQASQAPQPPLQQQPTGGDRAFFDRLGQTTQQPTQQPQQIPVQRQRPQPPPQPQGQTQNSFLPAPPINRSASAPQNQQPSAFGPPPLQPQMTGYQAQPAPPGQSLNELNQQRLQQQFTQSQQMVPVQPQPTGFGFGNQPRNQFQSQQAQPQPTGFYPQQPQQYQQPNNQQQLTNGQFTGSPFADPPRAPFQPLQPQQTGFQPNYPQQPMQPQPTGVNSVLPPALQPQPTGITSGFGGLQSQPTGFGQQPQQLQPTGFGQQPQQQQQLPSIPPLPPMPQQTPAPLQPQKTGPAPPIKFGLNNPPSKLTPQPTGKANLSNASEFPSC